VRPFGLRLSGRKLLTEHASRPNVRL